MFDIGFNQIDLIKSIALFYLLLSTSFILEILTCSQKNQIKENKYIQYTIAFFIFYFLVTLVTNKLNLPPIEQLFHTIFYFIIFIITTRLDLHIISIILLLVFIVFFIEINKDYYSIKDNKLYWITLKQLNINIGHVNKEQLQILTHIETIIYYIICILLVFGLIVYRGELKTLTHGTTISLYNLFINTNNCSLQYKKTIWEYFKIGITI